MYKVQIFANINFEFNIEFSNIEKFFKNFEKNGRNVSFYINLYKKNDTIIKISVIFRYNKNFELNFEISNIENS